MILAFYPGDFTTVCTKQFCSYRDNGDQLDGLGAEVLGISPQSVDSHERFIEEKSLNVPLLADEDLAVAKAVRRRWRRAGSSAGRSSSSTARASSATATSRSSASSYDGVDDLEQAVAAIR